MKRTCWHAVAVAVGASLLLGCPTKEDPCVFGDEEGCVVGAPPPDLCNSISEALGDDQCKLTLGTALTDRYIGASGDQDYYSAQLGALTPRSLLHVTGGYGVPATPVNFAINILDEGGTTSIMRRVDKHGQAAPRPVDIIVPYTTSNSKIIVLVSDEAIVQSPPYDVRNPYSIMVETMENPDTNEPNDTTPTTIPITPAGAEATGTASGMLATDNDVDQFAFTVPSAGAARRILYLHITAPKLTPAPPFRVAYKLSNAAGTPVAEGQMANEFLAIDLATARLVNPNETYKLEIFGYRSMNTVGVIPGDLRLRYTIDVRFMDDQDTFEGTTGNDTLANARATPLALGTPVTINGRIAYVPDPDWYAITLPANANATVLSARLRPGTGGGRFPPLAATPDRQLRITTPVSVGANATERQNNCRNDRAVCPKSFDAMDVKAQQLVDSLCTAFDPPHCLMSERLEAQRWDNMRNFDARIPVPPHAGNVTYYVIVQDDGQNFADDLNYDLRLVWEADADDTARLAAAAQVTAITENASVPNPPAAGEVTGELTHGYGRVVNHDLLQGEGVRAPDDYDAVATDLDRFQFNFPAVTAPLDRTWTLQWTIENGDAGTPPGDVILEAQFCSGAPLPDGGCGISRTIGWIPGRVEPWYDSNFSARTVIWDKQVVGNTTVVTAQPAGCFCMEPRGMQAGRMFGSVGAVDRVRPDNIRYTVRMGLAPYPASFVQDGGSVSCPAAGADGGGGCNFTGVP
jgi:hypothetical protein